MANLTMLEDDWGAKGAQMTGAQVQQIIKDALRQCARWATEPVEAQTEEAEYVVVNAGGVPKKVSVKKFMEMVVQSDELKNAVADSNELKELILQSDELKRLIEESIPQEENIGQDFINELFGLSE